MDWAFPPSYSPICLSASPRPAVLGCGASKPQAWAWCCAKPLWTGTRAPFPWTALKSKAPLSPSNCRVSTGSGNYVVALPALAFKRRVRTFASCCYSIVRAKMQEAWAGNGNVSLIISAFLPLLQALAFIASIPFAASCADLLSSRLFPRYLFRCSWHPLTILLKLFST